MYQCIDCKSILRRKPQRPFRNRERPNHCPFCGIQQEWKNIPNSKIRITTMNLHFADPVWKDEHRLLIARNTNFHEYAYSVDITHLFNDTFDRSIRLSRMIEVEERIRNASFLEKLKMSRFISSTKTHVKINNSFYASMEIHEAIYVYALLLEEGPQEVTAKPIKNEWILRKEQSESAEVKRILGII